MSSVGGNTTVTEAASAASVDSQEAALLWLFPRSRAPVALWVERKRELTIGRDEASDVCLTGNDVSRRHAILYIDPGSPGSPDAPGSRVRIADLGSRNGVRVNGRPVSEAPIGVGDVVRLGGWVGVVAASAGDFGEIAPGLWGGAVLRAALAPLRTAAASNLPIVLEGETGTGKEMARPGAPPLERPDRAAFRRQLRGAPEGAGRGRAVRLSPRGLHRRRSRQRRLFSQREGGTLLLDEVSDLPLGAAGQAAARPRGARGAAARRDPPGPDRRPHRRGRPAAAHGGGAGRGAFGPICWRASTG